MREDRKGRLPNGWFAAAAGGVIGTVAGGYAGLALSGAYVDTYQSDGLEGLGTMIITAAVGAWIGAAAGAALSLRVFGHARPIASGFCFALFGTIILLTFGSVGQLILPEGLRESVGPFLLFSQSPLLAGIAARALTATPRVASGRPES